MEVVNVLEAARARVSGGLEQKDDALATARAWAEVDLSHLRENGAGFCRILPKGCRLMATVKANGYGHGDIQTARMLNRMGIRSFAVASLEEGMHLRKNGIKGDILILGYTYPMNIRKLVRFDLVQTITDLAYAEALNSSKVQLRVHVKIDTGMHRLGIAWDDREKVRRVFSLPNLKIEGTFSHLSVSDSTNASDEAFTREQIRRFFEVLDTIREDGFDPGKVHLQSTYGVLNYPELQMDYARIGIGLYGVLSEKGAVTRIPSDFLKPVLSLRARISTVREVNGGEAIGYGRCFYSKQKIKMAVVGIGYGDGIPRSLSEGKGSVLVRGRRTPIIGRICMDQLFIDVTDVPDVTSGEIVTLIGSDGEETISAEDMAQACGSITNDLLSRIGARIGRVYVE